MSLLQTAAQLFLQKSGAGGGFDVEVVASALKLLLPGDGDDLDIGALVAQFGAGDMASILGSWLGDGDNDALAGSKLTDILGSDNVASFASRLGMEPGQAVQGLSGMIPELINRNSSGGSLLDSVGGAAGVADFAKKLF